MDPSLNLDTSTLTNRDFSQNSQTTIANSVDTDETARYEPSHQDLHFCFSNCFFFFFFFVFFFVCRDDTVKFDVRRINLKVTEMG